MASDWSSATIQELATKVTIGPFGSSLKTDAYTPAGVPVIRGTNLCGGRSFVGDWVYVSDTTADRLPAANVSAGDLVFPHRGAIGEVGLVPADRSRYLLSTSLMRASLDERVCDSRFYFYFFRSQIGRAELLKNASQVGTPGIGQPLSTLKAIRVPVPELAEQRRIANVLCSLDDRIDHNRELAANLEAISRALFKSWFVDFEPVRARTAGEVPLGLHPDLGNLFPDRFIESELGEIPDGWNASTIAEVCFLNPDSWTGRNHPEAIEYLDLANVKSGEIENRVSYSWNDSPSRARRVLRSGDTIVGTVRPGNRSFALIAEEGLTGSTGFAALRPKSELLREFVYLAATSNDAIDRLAHLADGAAYPAVRPDVVVATEIVLPSDDVLKEFSAIVKPLVDLVAVARSENAVLTQVRDLLLPRLISGKISVEDVEAALEVT